MHCCNPLLICQYCPVVIEQAGISYLNSLHAGKFACFFVICYFFSKIKFVRKILSHTVKPVLSCQSKRRQKICFQDRLLLNAGQKYCRMLTREYSAILSTFIMLPFVILIFVLSVFEWSLKTGFTVHIPSNSLGPDHARWPDLDPNCLQRISADQVWIQDFSKGVHIYKSVGVRFDDFISFFLNIP